MPSLPKYFCLAVTILSQFAAFFCGSLRAQDIVINEFLASNDHIYPDNVDFDDYSDWIELRNTTGNEVSLNGYFLTDDPDQEFRWAFPADATIPANGFLVVRADGFDAVPNGTHKREFAPWYTFTGQRYHTNFSLSQSGEYIGLNRLDPAPLEVVLIPLESTWRYHDGNNTLTDDWMTPGYDDSQWLTGVAQFGYGDGDEGTVIRWGGSGPNLKRVTSYYRRTFNVPDPSIYSHLRCNAIIDDGAIVYLNGTEIARIRLPEGEVEYATLAGLAPDPAGIDHVGIKVSQLVPGDNVLTVEVHQQSRGTPDSSFDLELLAYDKTSPLIVADSITFDTQVPDVSRGRNPADSDNWTYFGEPTPNAPNDTSPTEDRTPSSRVEFSLASGFYTGPQTVTLSTASPGATIRYTLDASVPSSNSPEFTTPLAVTETTIVRARTFEADRIPGPLGTRSYFIDEPESELLMASFVVEPDKFFDPEIGIYDNVHKGREAPCDIELFAPDGTLEAKVSAGAKIGGENIWRFPQKPLNIAMRGKYGDDLLSYKLFPDEKLGTFDAWRFRNGGDDWGDLMLRDVMATPMVRGQMLCDTSAYRPCILFMNGEFWGIHNIRERLGDQYFFNTYGVNAGEYDQVDFKRTFFGRRFVAEEGTLDAYLALEDFVQNNDMAVPENYDRVAAELEVDNLIDWVSISDFVVNTSWPHNQKFWRAHAPGSKWKWIVNDIDRGFTQLNRSIVLDVKAQHPLFPFLIQNPEFSNRMAQRYAAHLSSTFHPDRIADIIDTLGTEVRHDLPRHIAKWGSRGGISSLNQQTAEIQKVKNHAAARAPLSIQWTATALGLPGATNDLTVVLTPPEGGRVLVSGVPILPEYTNVISLFPNVPFELTAEAAPGFAFAGWSTGDNASTIQHVLAADETITATFLPSAESLAPTLVDADMTFTTAGSPYAATGDIVVEAGATLTIEPGVTLRMPECASIYVHGAMNIAGTEQMPVTIEPRSAASRWGALAFVNATGSSTLSHFTLQDATLASDDPVELKAAISNRGSDLTIEHAHIEAPFPVFARGGSTVVRHSFVHPLLTSDGINIKDGAGLVEDCTFLGNEEPDTDAIDFDNVVNGVIQRNRIYAFRGPNSDGIDVGESCVDLLITENRIYNCSDKGVSVGQGSSTTLTRNLIVNCVLGVAVKDTGSIATIDQCTFAQNGVAVTTFEKNFLAGGGDALVTNCIFWRSKDADVTVDSLSGLTVEWSLSNSLDNAGTGNFIADPLFTDASLYDFSLLPGSPAIDAGDPAHPLDPDDSRADVGASYTYDPDDYPFQVPNSIVVNEILAHSAGGAPDWIELYNASEGPIDVSGWFLSDSGSDLQKYRIADNTIMPGNSYLVFYEDQHFGETSTDPGRMVPFAISENGETIHLFGPAGDLLLPYQESETFGPSATDVSKGRYFKASTNTFNFVAMSTATPGGPNSYPLVGPVVISEIMYHPSTGSAEFIELLNIDEAPVTLFDPLKNEPWKITQGFTFDFPTGPPVTIQPGERILLVQDASLAQLTYSIPAGIQVLQWTSGALNNNGEKLELSFPGDLDDLNERQFVRVDRVDYDDTPPWPEAPDLGLHSLTRIDDAGYGNDPANWFAAEPTPGYSAFDLWVAQQGFAAGEGAWNEDPDRDGRNNFYEYGTGTNPLLYDQPAPSPLTVAGGQVQLSFRVGQHPELGYRIQRSPDLTPGSWTDLPVSFFPDGPSTRLIQADDMVVGGRVFFRLLITP